MRKAETEICGASTCAAASCRLPLTPDSRLPFFKSFGGSCHTTPRFSNYPGPLPRFVCTQFGWSFRRSLLTPAGHLFVHSCYVYKELYICTHKICISALAFLPGKAVHLTRRLMQTNNLFRQAQQWDAARTPEPTGMAALERFKGRRAGCRMS